MTDKSQYEWVILSITQNPFDQRKWCDDNALYMWELQPKGHRMVVSSGMSYSEVKVLMGKFKVDHPSGLAGVTFVSKHSEASSALDLFIVEIKSGGKYNPPSSQEIRQMAAVALAKMELPDYSMLDGHTVYQAFAEVWDGFDPKGDWLAWFVHEISVLSRNLVELKTADSSIFNYRVKGPAAYMTLSSSWGNKRVVIGPYSTPVSFDSDQ